MEFSRGSRICGGLKSLFGFTTVAHGVRQHTDWPKEAVFSGMERNTPTAGTKPGDSFVQRGGQVRFLRHQVLLEIRGRHYTVDTPGVLSIYVESKVNNKCAVGLPTGGARGDTYIVDFEDFEKKARLQHQLFILAAAPNPAAACVGLREELGVSAGSTTPENSPFWWWTTEIHRPVAPDTHYVCHSLSGNGEQETPRCPDRALPFLPSPAPRTTDLPASFYNFP